MPKLIDYPRTSYTSAWEVAEVVDDTGGKCALETCARKLNRKVSGSFKAIVGSAVKFGLLTSKREILTTTTLFRRIKHAYDKQEEVLFHREAFLTPALFAQICRKFRSRELPVAMLDVLLIREFDVEEINAQAVAKAFVDGAHMVGILDEHNIIADIDQLAARQAPRRELASTTLAGNTFRPNPSNPTASTENPTASTDDLADPGEPATEAESQPAITPPPTTITTATGLTLPPSRPAPAGTSDAIASLFGLGSAATTSSPVNPPHQLAAIPLATTASAIPGGVTPTPTSNPERGRMQTPALPNATNRRQESRENPGMTTETATEAGTATASSLMPLFRLQLTGPGLNTELDVTDVDDLLLVRALLDKIERQLRR